MCTRDIADETGAGVIPIPKWVYRVEYLGTQIMNETYTGVYDEGTHDLDDSGIIPFADEVEVRHHREIPDEDLSESAAQEFGSSEQRMSVVDQALGLDVEESRMGAHNKYACPCCKRGATRVVRVRIKNQTGWVAVCAVCAASLLDKYPGTVVGGSVRPSRKRRSVKAPGAENEVHGFRSKNDQRFRHAG